MAEFIYNSEYFNKNIFFEAVWLAALYDHDR